MRAPVPLLLVLVHGCGAAGLIDDAGPDCPEPDPVAVDVEDETLGFTANDVLVVANARGPATFTWDDGSQSPLALLFELGDGDVEIPDPDFVPEYENAEAEAFCEKLAGPVVMSIAVDATMTTEDGGLDVRLPATLTAVQADGAPGFELASFGSDFVDVATLDGYQPPKAFQGDAYDEVVIEVYGWFDEARPIWLDEETSAGDGHGTISGHGRKAPGASVEDTCPDHHGSHCDFFVGFWAFD